MKLAKLIDGKKIAAEIRAEVAKDVAELRQSGIEPALAVILVGDDPASHVYVRNKELACQEVGIKSIVHRLPAATTEKEVLELLEKLNADETIHAILVQSPLPEHINENRVLLAIQPEKDADGLHPINLGRLLMGEPCLISCTPHGVQELLVRSGYDPAGKHVVIVGRSNLVGKPLAALLMQKAPHANATVTICHSRTKRLAAHTVEADILVAAMGQPEFIKSRMVKEGAVVIDVGTTRVADPTKKSGYRLVGDVDFERVRRKARAITPVPGGVGPMTVAMLLKNTVQATRNQIQSRSS